MSVLGAAAILVFVTEESTDVPKERTDGFGPLEAILGVISTVYADHEVRSRLPLTTLL